MNRDKFLETLYDWSRRPYQSLKRTIAWKVDINHLRQFPEHTLGGSLAHFLESNHFTIQSKLESHDIFHVLTGTGTTVPEEISMQFYLFGNGKRSPYGALVMGLGALLYPEHWGFFRTSFIHGRNSHVFHYIDFEKLLHKPLIQLQDTFCIIQNHQQ